MTIRGETQRLKCSMLSIAFAVIVMAAHLSSINAQQDLTFCDVNTIPQAQPVIPFPEIFSNIEMQYQRHTEQNHERKMLAEEIYEYYDGKANRGVVIIDSDGLRTFSFAYFDTNELLLVEGDKCIVRDLSQNLDFTPFGSTLQGGKLHIANMETMLVKDVKKVYIGQTLLRNIPVDQWQTCVYDDTKKTTYRITLAYSVSTQWVPAIGSLNGTVYTVPVQTMIESKSNGDQTVSTDVYSYTEYRAGLLIDEDDYLVPRGVYCPGRNNTKKLPNIPSSYTLNVENLQPVATSDGRLGFKSLIKMSYDYNKQLIRFDYSQSNLDYYEVHDFNAGLRYKINKNIGNCTVLVLNETDLVNDGGEIIGSTFHLKDPIAFIGINASTAQYVGRRKVLGLNTDVWISPKKIGGVIDAMVEWYFQTDQWISQESAGINTNEPVMTVVYFKANITDSTNKTREVLNVFQSNIYDFDSTGIHQFDFDISPACFSEVRNERLSFRIDADQDTIKEIKNSNDQIKVGVTKSMVSYTGISFIRVTNVRVTVEDNLPNPDENGVYVRMNLFEKPQVAGNPGTNDTVALDDAIAAFKKSISDDKFIISFLTTNNQVRDVKIVPISVRVGSRFGGGPFCLLSDFVADPRKLPLPVMNQLSQYQATVEKNVGSKLHTEEINEFYDGIGNIGIAIVDTDGLRSKIYAYYATNELFVVVGDNCLVVPLNESIGYIPFSVINTGTSEHIATPLSYLLLLPNVTFVYLGSRKTDRGIPVNQWRTCYTSQAEKKTYKITVSYSDPDQWVPAVGSFEDKTSSVPVEIEVETEDEFGNRTREINSIVKYKLGLLLSEEDYATPPGVYCNGRKNQKEIPSIPDSFSFHGEMVQAIPNTFGLFGTISNIREELDFKKNLFRFDYNEKGSPVYEIHDFNNGLRYYIEKFTDTCKIMKLSDGIDTESGQVTFRLRNPMEFFDLDNVPVQYAGLRNVKGANTNVWVGPKKINDKEAIFEWLFLTDQWVQHESLEVSTNELVQINIYTKESVINNQNKSEEVTVVQRYNVYAFDSLRIDDFHFDISKCLGIIESKVVSFTVPLTSLDAIKSGMVSFRKGVVDAIVNVTGVTPLRISNVNVDMTTSSQADTTVSFNLLAKPTEYGNVEDTTKDKVELADALSLIEQAISKNALAITFATDKTSTQSVSAQTGSFQQAEYNKFHSRGKTGDFSTTSLIIGIVVSIVVSLALGAIGTILFNRIRTARRS